MKFEKLMNVNFEEQFKKLERNIEGISFDKFIRKQKVKQMQVKFQDLSYHE